MSGGGEGCETPVIGSDIDTSLHHKELLDHPLRATRTGGLGTMGHIALPFETFKEGAVVEVVEDMANVFVRFLRQSLSTRSSVAVQLFLYKCFLILIKT